MSEAPYSFAELYDGTTEPPALQTYSTPDRVRFRIGRLNVSLTLEHAAVLADLLTQALQESSNAAENASR